MASPTAGWEKVGDRFYRKIRLYDTVFDQDLELEKCIVVGATCAGAIALYRDQEKFHTYRNAQSSQSSIDIYSCAGNLIRRIPWDNGLIRGCGWSEDETLVVVSEKGSVRCYKDFQVDFTQFTLGHDAEQHGVNACRFLPHGFVAMLANNQLIAVSHYLEPRPKRLATFPPGSVHSWTVVPPTETLSRSVEVFVAVEKTIYVVDSNEAEDRVLPNGPFKHVVASPSGLYLALYTEEGRVWVITSDFQEKLGEYESRTKTVPNDIQWCGNDSVLLAWEDEVQMIGPHGSTLKFYYDDWVHLIPDVDGVRLLTNEVCEFLQKVPDATEEIFRLGSTSPSSVLFDASQQLEKGSPRADENIQLIRQNLPEAVAVCVEASGQQHGTYWQRQLLRAASFGKSVLDLYSGDDFVEMCQTLRILNAVHEHKIAMPVTNREYKHLTPERLIRRLLSRHEFLLAIRLSEFLRLPTNHIYVHWASHKVRMSQADEEAIYGTVVSRLKSKRGISFETVARAAHDEGRSHLATELLNQESRAGKQVPLLMSMSEDEIALEKAVASGDTDLVYYVLLHLKRSLPLASFFRTVTSRPIASALVESSARLQDQALLKDLYYQDDRRTESALFLFSEALMQKVPQLKVDKIKIGTESLADNSKDATVSQMLKTFQEAQTLVRLQSSLERDLAPSAQAKYVGLSVNGTIFQLILHSQFKRAHRISQDFHVSPQVYEWIRLRALVAARNWHELEDIGSKTKKSTIGWEAYFNEVLGAGNTRLAGGTFVTKCTALTARERSQMWVKCGMIQNAGEELARVKDIEGLENLKKSVGAADKIELDRYINGMKPKR